jgi:NurA domain
MLDLNQLARQMQGISQHLVEESVALRQRLNRAEELMVSAQKVQAELVNQQALWRDRLIFTAAIPIEPLNTRTPIALAPKAHTVIATDGSQIAPSHHEIAYCYLLNIGRIILHYGQSKLPLLDSLPEVFYRPEDLYVSRQWGVRTEEWMGYCRTSAESTVLAELAESFASATDAPIIAMTDGSLLHWFLEPLPGEARDRILQPILESWAQLRAMRVPIVGYISASRSGEATNFLRLHTCPYIAPDCATHCADLPNKAPCQVLDPLRDAGIWGRLLAPGERSPLWRSSAKIQDFYGDDYAIHFCYVNVGAEVARVEVPAWVALDAEVLAMTLSLVVAQVQKGYGYPVALAEAHNQAVVRGGDRTRFFALLEREMVKAGLRNVGTSYKEARKRGSIA